MAPRKKNHTPAEQSPSSPKNMAVEVALAQENIWFDKYKYEDAERAYYEKLGKLLKSEGNNKQPEAPKFSTPAPVLAPNPVAAPVPLILNIAPSEPQPRGDDKRFKVKNRTKSKKDTDRKVEKTVMQELKVSSNNLLTKVSLAEEVAKARQHIKSSLECVDGIAKLTTDSLTVEVNNRLSSLELENSTLKKEVNSLSELVKKLTDRISKLEVSGGGKSAPAPAAAAPAPAQKPAAKPKDDDDDDGVDLFGSDSEEEDEGAKKIKEQRLAEYAAKKSKKPVLIAKSNIILDVKPWDDETDMKKMEVEVRKINTQGLIWGASKLVPLAYGIHKLQISCVVEDDIVSVDWLQEKIESIEDFVQSVDIAAFNKV